MKVISVASPDRRLLQSAVSRRDLRITGPGCRSVMMHALAVASRNRRPANHNGGSAPAGQPAGKLTSFLPPRRH